MTWTPCLGYTSCHWILGSLECRFYAKFVTIDYINTSNWHLQIYFNFYTLEIICIDSKGKMTSHPVPFVQEISNECTVNKSTYQTSLTSTCKGGLPTTEGKRNRDIQTCTTLILTFPHPVNHHSLNRRPHNLARLGALPKNQGWGRRHRTLGWPVTLHRITGHENWQLELRVRVAYPSRRLHSD